MSAHTPGPWFAEPYGPHRELIVAPGRSFAVEVEGDNRGADARLIAAAPEMFAALKALAAIPGHNDAAGGGCSICDAKAMARAAIAKAEGKS